MPIPAKGAQLDTLSSVIHGMNAGVQPRLVPPGQVALAINVTFRGGFPRTRPVYRKVPLIYPDTATQTAATQALFQCAHGYQAFATESENALVSLIGGRVFRYLVGSTNTVQDLTPRKTTLTAASFVIPAVGFPVTVTVDNTTGMVVGGIATVGGSNYTITSITPTVTVVITNLNGHPGDTVGIKAVFAFGSDTNSSVLEDGWMWQSEDFLIINNGQSFPYFFDGAQVRRSLGPAGNELPVGCMGAYVQGRNWMVLPDRRSFMASDLVYSHGFTDGYQGRSAVLQTLENEFLSGGGAFGVPVQAGLINAMASVAIADTSLGQGALSVMTQTSVFNVNTPIDRTQWVTTQFPLMVVGLPNYGSVSQTGVAPVNGDLWYRSSDGIRSYQIGRRDLGTWVNTPLSVEVQPILALDTPRLLDRASSVLFNNRFLVTCSPYTVEGRGTVHRGIVALDFHNISTLTSSSSYAQPVYAAAFTNQPDPAYDGLWTGLNILQLVKGIFNGTERCFAFALDADNSICLYELMMDNVGWFDWNGTDLVGVQSVVETRSMLWADTGGVLKRLLCGDLYLDRVAGNDQVLWSFQYRSDEDPIWNDWHSFSLCAPVKDCRTEGCPTFQDVREQYRTYLRLPDPRDTPCNPITRRSPRTGYEFQIRLAWTGFSQVNRFNAWAMSMADSVISACPSAENCKLLTSCAENWFSYSVES